MKIFMALSCFVIGFWVFSVSAQELSTLISDKPICSMIKNTTNHTIFVGVRTAFFEHEGETKRHQANLRLEEGKEQEICVQGPFYEGYKVELTLRTLIPVFTCLTQFGSDIRILSQTDADNITRFSATCF
jgi:hypothetical protein